MTVRILIGDVREQLRTLPEQSVNCVVTSPPYWGLRDYGVDGQIGLEATPAEFLATMTDVFREVRRVLRDDGTCWMNMGDSYAGGRRSSYDDSSPNKGNVGAVGLARPMTSSRRRDDEPIPRSDVAIGGLKPKDLVGMPWRLAFALQDDGWYLRQDIVWAKPNPMPESVRDRCTKSHEYIFLLSKSERYWFDQEAIAEPCSESTHARLSQDAQNQIGSLRANGGDERPMKAGGRSGNGVGWGHGTDKDERGRGRVKAHLPGNKSHKGTTAYEAGDEKQRTKAGLVDYSTKVRKLAEAGSGTKNNESFDAAMAVMPDTRNKRSVWTIATKGFSEAHFATFPPELPEICIKAGCPVGGTVLDPFFGAGTTGLVADRLQRNAIGIELNPAYAEMARRRIHGDSPLFAEVA